MDNQLLLTTTLLLSWLTVFNTTIILFTIILVLAGWSAIFAVIIFPILFNCWIIPEIEKKLCKKLEWELLMYKQFYYFGRWASYLEISIYIVLKYLGWKRRLSPRRALVIAKYRKSMFSRAEILMSFAAMINFLIFWIASITGTVWLHLDPSLGRIY